MAITQNANWPSRSDDSDLRSFNINAYLAWLATHIGELKVLENMINSGMSPTVYSAATEYSQYDAVLVPDIGSVYVFVGATPATGDNPVSNTNDNWNLVLSSNTLAIPAGSYGVTRIIGGDYYRNSSYDITVGALYCYSDDGQTMIYCNNQNVSVSVATATNYKNNLFACSDGVVRVSEYDDGSDILTSYDVALAWIGCMPTNMGGGFVPYFTQKGPFIVCGPSLSMLSLATLSTTAAAVDHSSMIPIDRIDMILYGACNSVGNQVYTSHKDSSSYIESRLCITGALSSAVSDPGIWGDEVAHIESWLPFHNTQRYFRAGGGSPILVLRGLKMRRT